MSQPDYRLIARRAVPVKADCYVCDMTWHGTDARIGALAHLDDKGHPVWIECVPANGDTER